MQKDLHLKKGHPINTVKMIVEKFFNTRWSKETGCTMEIFDNFSPVMSTRQAFDELLVPPDHPSRSSTDTYYVSPEVVLRPHTSAHQNELIRAGHMSFLCTGDVYRRDTVDTTHYPIFHQMEGVHVFQEDLLATKGDDAQQVEFVAQNMKTVLEKLTRSMLGPVDIRWVHETFPFTTPSFELEILFRGQWLEIVGCGVIHQDLLKNCNQSTKKGWAFGIGLERLAMILFAIPDIRLFWSQDLRFHKQFQEGKVSKFIPYSKYPPCYKDVAFWIPEKFALTSFHELVREVGGDLVEEVKLIDQFIHPMNDKRSLCWRINYRSMDRSLTNEEVDKLQFNLRTELAKRFKVELR
eukprot:TRINITY_DN5531_c0_g1_i2.p1 TRINITY_DN5531_c0_g1~~TRINITY_DN5531_c0_g1_i2.p1  ORF type:complete len:351 (-),score=59.88 TRINITY_DN5531_c0_g1_i2:242-1294(-)